MRKLILPALALAFIGTVAFLVTVLETPISNRDLVLFEDVSMIAAKNKHTCIHDKIAKTNGNHEISAISPPDNIQDDQKRQLATDYSTYVQISIGTDYSAMGFTGSQVDLVQSKIIPIATSFLQRRLQVLNKALNYVPATQTTCYQAPLPSKYQWGTGFDLLIMVTGSNEPTQSFLAWATKCLVDYKTGRPILGQINFNLALMSTNIEDLESQIDTALHELTHVLAFSPSLYGKYIDSNLALLGESKVFTIKNGVYTIITPKVVQAAKSHFGCSSIVGVPLENEGDSGSAGAHWERMVLNNEAMTASDIPNAAYSIFTMSLLEDSGWYKADMKLAEPFFWGKNSGCDFFNYGCLSGDTTYFCQKVSAKACSYDYEGSGYCAVDSFSSKCMYTRLYSNGKCSDPNNEGQYSVYFGESFGTNSKCFNSSLIMNGYSSPGYGNKCYKYSCSSTNQLTVTLRNGSSGICTMNGQSLSINGYKGSIICPDPTYFCNIYYKKCEGECSQNGYCNNGNCECRAGYTGSSCQTVV